MLFMDFSKLLSVLLISSTFISANNVPSSDNNKKIQVQAEEQVKKDAQQIDNSAKPNTPKPDMSAPRPDVYTPPKPAAFEKKPSAFTPKNKQIMSPAAKKASERAAIQREVNRALNTPGSWSPSPAEVPSLTTYPSLEPSSFSSPQNITAPPTPDATGSYDSSNNAKTGQPI